MVRIQKPEMKMKLLSCGGLLLTLVNAPLAMSHLSSQGEKKVLLVFEPGSGPFSSLVPSICGETPTGDTHYYFLKEESCGDFTNCFINADDEVEAVNCFFDFL
jgi:hypothetical protein